MVNILAAHAKKRRIIRHVVITIGGLCLFVSQQITATAFFDNVLPYSDIQTYVATELTYDNNVLRLPKNFTPDLSGNRTNTSSFIKQFTAGVALKWQLSQQKITADISVNQNWYLNYHELNYMGHNFLGQWNWFMTTKLKGELSYTNRLALGNFGQINKLLVDNFENRESYFASGNYEFAQNWYLHAHLTRSTMRYAVPVRQISNLCEISQEFGLRYRVPLDRSSDSLENMLGIRVIVTDGRYTMRSDAYILSSGLDNAYSRTTFGLEGRWHYSTKTRFRGDIGYVSQEYKHLKNHDFSSIIARGDVLWEVTPKTSLFLEVWREVSPADSLIATFVLNNAIALTPKWTWSETPKIQVELPMTYQQQTGLGNTGLSNNSTTLLQTTLTSVRLNLNYTPITNVEVTAYAAYESRHSSNPLHSYNDEMLGITMRVGF